MLNIHLYPSPLTHESRILKESQAIASFSDFSCIVLVGAACRGLTDAEMLDESRTIMRFSRDVPAWLPATVGKVLGVAAWSWRVFRCFSTKPVSCINCHSLSTLPLGVALKFRTGAKLVYDPHELETESNGLGGFRRTIAKVVERAFYSRADEVIVVGDGIADWYQRTYGGRRPAVVLNCPLSRKPERTSVLRRAVGLPPDATIYLYQGILGKGRGVEMMLEAFADLGDPGKVLVFLGMGPLEGRISEVAARTPCVHLHPAVRPHELAEYTASADVGLCLIEDTCLSYRYCMPNKLFEYFAAGIPTVVSNLPEIAGVVSRTGSGWVVVEWSAGALRSVVESIDAAQILARRVAVENAGAEFTWENQVPVLRQVYARLGFLTAPSP